MIGSTARIERVPLTLPHLNSLVARVAASPEERGPTETEPGRKAETDRVFEGISEGFPLVQSGRVAPRGVVATPRYQATFSL